MSQTTLNNTGPRSYTAVAAINNQSTSAQDQLPVLYPAVQPSKTLDTPTGPATLFVSGDPGTFTVTGNTSGIIVHRELAGATGVYLLTGNAGVTRLTHGLAGATGVYTETGSAAGIIVARKLLGGTGAFAETGNAAGIIVHRELSGGTGVFTETGNDGLFKLVVGGGTVQNFMAGGTGVFAVTGNDGLFQLVARPEAQGGISGYLKAEKIRYRGANLMVQPMSEATRRAEKIMVGWRDEEEAMMLVQIIETFYD